MHCFLILLNFFSIALLQKGIFILVTWQNLFSANVCKKSFLRGSFIGVFPLGITFQKCLHIIMLNFQRVVEQYLSN